MPAGHVQVQPDGTGKDIDASTLTSTESGTPSVYRQNVVNADPVNYASQARVFAPGQLRVNLDPTQLFYETFDYTIDTVNRWAAPVASGSGAIAAAWTPGQALLTGGTASNAYSELHSQYSFFPTEPSWLLLTQYVAVETPVLTTGYRFWGVGQTTSAPTIAAPLTDAVGWEVATTGKMYAVTYAAGTRNVIGDLSVATGNAAQPTDGNTHKYGLYIRGDLMYWTIDNFDAVVATLTSGANGPAVNQLPIKFLAVSNSGTAVTIPVAAISLGDVARNNHAISDGANPWRKARVGAGGDLSASVTSPAAAALGIFGLLNPYGSQRVSVEPTVTFFDPFDGAAIDVTNRWATAGSNVPTQASGAVTLAATVGASVNNASTLISQPTFVSPGLGFALVACTVTLEASQVSAVNVNRFWGKGQVTSYAYATPVTDGVGFEVEGTVGALQCVIWIGGTKYVVNSTNAALVSSSIAGAGGSGTALPSGAAGSNYGSLLTWKGGQHRYAVFVRSDVIYWFVEGVEVPVAVLAYASPNVQGLPLRFAAITNGSATSLAYTFQAGAVAVMDSTAQNHMISDGVYPWRKATVTPGTPALAIANIANTSALTQVASSASSVTLLAANASRKNAIFYNASTAILYIALTSSAASTSAYTVQVAAGGNWSMPVAWTGQITGIWASANGNAIITELS